MSSKIICSLVIAIASTFLVGCSPSSGTAVSKYVQPAHQEERTVCAVYTTISGVMVCSAYDTKTYDVEERHYVTIEEDGKQEDVLVSRDVYEAVEIGSSYEFGQK